MSLTTHQGQLVTFSSSFGLLLSCLICVSVVETTPTFPKGNVELLSATESQYLKDFDSLSRLLQVPVEEWNGTKFQRNFVKHSSVINNFFKEFNQKSISPVEFGLLLDDLFEGIKSDHCKGHILEWMIRFRGDTNLFLEQDTWVLQMIDSWGKLPEGILSGHLNSIGDYDECIEINVKDLKILNNEYTSISTSFAGRYCTAYVVDYNSSMAAAGRLKVPTEDESIKLLTGNGIKKAISVEELLKMMSAPMSGMIPSLGVCMPNSCSEPEIHAFFTNAFSKLYESIPGGNPEMMPYPLVALCSEKAKPALSAADIVMITILSIIVAVSVIAGVLDYYQQDSKSSTSSHQSSTAYKYLMAFSFYNNTRKWLSTRKSPDDLGCLHGIRFLSTCWVVLSHTYAVFGLGVQWNMVDAKKIYEAWTLMPILNGTFSVDTFFVMSGMLATFNILKMLDKTGGKFNVIMFYVHRYIRLTPTYAILVGIMATLVVYLGNGPNWYIVEMQAQLCKDNWWTNLLYINNIVKSDQFCNDESWYLSNDMQFYILSPLIVFPLWKWFKHGLSLLTVYTILSVVAPVLLVRYGNDVPPIAIFSRERAAGFVEIYIRPWTRIQTFLVGVWLGWLLHKTRGQRVHIPRIAVAVLWTLSTILAIVVIYSVRNWFEPYSDIPEIPGYFYAAFGRFSWALVVAWVIFACIKGYGGAINKFLSWKVFMPLGRLTFCVYLTSFHLQVIFHSRLTVPIKYETYMMVNLFLAHMSMSLLVGYLCTILFESPFIILQKLIFDGGSSSKPQLRQKQTDGTGEGEKDDKSSKRYGVFYEKPDAVIDTQQKDTLP